MNALARPSEWESDVLGVRVGALSAYDVPPVSVVQAENKTAFDVVFISCPKWVDQQNGMVAIDHLYDMEMEISEDRFIKEPASTLVSPSKRHIEIAKSSTIESRFTRDPKLADRSQKRYVRWLTDHKAYVPAETPSSAFLVPTDDDDEARRISLIMTDEKFRGSGIGTRLVRGAFSAEPQVRLWRVKVSSRNHRAFRFYETVGFRVKSVSTVFHVWM